MTLSELIEKAQNALKTHGDLDVVVHQESEEYGHTLVEIAEAKWLDVRDDEASFDGEQMKAFCITDEIG